MDDFQIKHSRGWKVLLAYFMAVAILPSDLEEKKLFSLWKVFSETQLWKGFCLSRDPTQAWFAFMIIKLNSYLWISQLDEVAFYWFVACLYWVRKTFGEPQSLISVAKGSTPQKEWKKLLGCKRNADKPDPLNFSEAKEFFFGRLAEARNDEGKPVYIYIYTYTYIDLDR